MVTGAGGGIGRATARAFAAHGAEVVCADLDLDAARRTADGICQRPGGTAHAARVDVADAGEMEEFAGHVRPGRHGVPDIVVNNAGIVVAGRVPRPLASEDWRGPWT